MANLKRILILGGTGDAVELALKVVKLPGFEVITALAGRTQQPVLPSDHTHIGGFGGIPGLIDYLREQQIDRLVDATHPFAVQISYHAAAAAATVGIPRLILMRPAWEPIKGDRWLEVDSYARAAALLPDLAQRIFLSIGRQELAFFSGLHHLWFLMRMIEPPRPDAGIPPGTLLLERGPFSLEKERSLLQQFAIDAIVSKNSGGSATYAKVMAAREMAIPVVMVQRPAMPRGELVSTVESALLWLQKKD